jgi:regulator of replication initiation timing
MSLANVVIGVPTASTIRSNAAAKQNKTTLEMLLNIQQSLDEFKEKVAEMDEEMRTVKLENTILKNKIHELMSSSSTAKSSSSLSLSHKRGFFGYGADEF